MKYFIVGTDTNCGKTFYAKKLANNKKHVIKPIETGKETFENLNDSDTMQLANIQTKTQEEVNLYFFDKPYSPHLAAKIDNTEIKINEIVNFINLYNEVYIELAGGLMVPLNDNYTQLDLIKDVQGKVVLVIGNKLGCINHALLTIEVLKKHDIKIVEIIFNDFGTNNEMTEDNKKTIRKLGGL